MGCIVGGLLVDDERDEKPQFADLHGDGLYVDAIDAMFDEVEFSGIIGVVDVAVESFFDVGQPRLAFLSFFHIEGFARLFDGYFDHEFLPHFVGGVELPQDVHHLLEHAHRESA